MLTPDERKRIGAMFDRVLRLERELLDFRLEDSNLSSQVSDLEEKVSALDMRLFNLEPKVALSSAQVRARNKRKPKSKSNLGNTQ